ncbi:MAG TPA: Rieske 2Fe-2S domain-containing protein [Actinomycetota bacterium]|nr:Rieske 2Fe-2S domain-containing protein [Actinomycetota bacterium]
MMIAKISTTNLILIGIAVLVGLAGVGMITANIFAIMRAKKDGPASQRPLIGAPKQLSRRSFFGRTLFIGFGTSMTAFGTLSVGFLWPNLKGGFGAKITLPQTAEEILKQIQETNEPYFNSNGRFYLVPYSQSSEGGNRYAQEGTAAGGLMALYQKCVHLGCRVPFCANSQWFECPCHGSKYNRAGEWKLGPAARGLDRMVMSVEGGIVTVDTGNIITGPPRGTNTTGQEKEGPFCV